MVIWRLLFISIFVSATRADDAPVVEVLNGLLQGTFDQSYNGRTFSSFEGIPYAKPPIGELRFEAPKEPYNWTGTWIANTRHACIQSYVGATTLGVSGDEDCLYLNVYVPRSKLSASDNLKVLVHIHGGAFMLGSGHFYAGPKYLMDEEIILVTINYRLGPFGFLSTEDEVVPGNVGLKDQVRALKWIRKNIKFFGGNPNSVTISGISAGGASVHFHYFSPLSKGLFHRGISQSGNALDPWTMQERGLNKAKRLAVLVGCPVDSSKEMIQCLKSRSAYKIADVVKEFFVYDGFPFSPFAPVVEKKHKGAFLTEHPYKLLVNKKVADIPWITSVTEREGIYPAAFFEDRLALLDQDFDKIIPHILDYNYTVSDSQRAFVSKKIREYYFKESVNLHDLIMACGDRHFKYEAGAAAKLQAKATESPVYFYILGYRGEHSLSELFSHSKENLGASHADDALYYFSTFIADGKLIEADENMKSIYMQWILSFANIKEPKINGVLWKPVTRRGRTLDVLYISSPEDINMVALDDLGSRSFWSNLPLKENEKLENIRDEL